VTTARVALLAAFLVVAGAATGCSNPTAGPAAISAPTVGQVTRGPVEHTSIGTGALAGANGSGGEAVVPFDERAAASIAAGQKVRLRFDAVPGLTLPGEVLAVAPTGVPISGVTSYYVTIVLTGGGDARLRGGMTVQATVITNSLTGVLRVPNAAVVNHRFVRVPGAGGEPTQVQFTPGLVGDSMTQVLSGLTEGQSVLLN
jgi:hypothetical protein